MYPRPKILLQVENALGKEGLFIELREVISFYAHDKRLLSLAKRLHNYMTIRHDFRKTNALVGEVLEAQRTHKTQLHPYLYSAGFFHAITLYSRWFKATAKRPKLDDEIIDYMRTLPDFERVYEMAKPRDEIVEPFRNNPYI